MASLDSGYPRATPERIDMDDAARECAVARFVGLLGNERARFTKNVGKAVDRRSTFAPEDMNPASLDFGMQMLLAGERPSPKDPAGLVYFFVHYFVLAHDEATEERRHKLLRRLHGAPQEQLGFSPLMFELAVGNSFASRGRAVEYILEGDSGSPDLKISWEADTLYIECKCRTSAIGHKYLDLRLELFNLVSEAARKLCGPSDVLRVRYVGPRVCGATVAMAALKELLASSASADTGLSNPHWELKRDELPSRLTGQTLVGGVADLPALFRELPGILTFDVPNHGWVTINTIHPWGLAEVLNDAMSDAVKKQLPTSGLRMVWLQVLGAEYLAAGTENPNVLAEVALRKNDFRNRLEREYNKRNGFLGALICSDFHLLDLGDGLVRLNYTAAHLRTPDENDYRKYCLSFLGISPEELQRASERTRDAAKSSS